jgi:hypothetical protein
MPGLRQNNAINVCEHHYHYSIEMLLYLKTLPPFRFNPFLESHLPFRLIQLAYRAMAGSACCGCNSPTSTKRQL